MRSYSWGSNPKELLSLQEGEEAGEHTHRKGHGRQQWEGTTCKLRRAPKITLASTLMLGFQSPERWENTFLWVESPSLWYSFMAAWADLYAQYDGKSLGFGVRQILALHILAACSLVSNLPSPNFTFLIYEIFVGVAVMEFGRHTYVKPLGKILAQKRYLSHDERYIKSLCSHQFTATLLSTHKWCSGF